MDAQSILKDITSVTKKWTRQRKAEERRKSATSRRPYVYSNRVCATEIVHDVIPKAYMKASSGGTLPAHARQIMYAARGPIQALTGQPLNDKYFTQTLLPDFMAANPTMTADWDVVFDARGHFLEPHTGKEVPLGTLEVRNYLSGGNRRDKPVRRRWLFPNRAAGDRFGAVLFIEKEGFFPLFRRVRLAERHDIAVMSTKGMSVVAARHLIDNVCGRQGIPLMVLHDFDKAGFSILGTLQLNNRRYSFKHDIEVIDLGLRLSDVGACNLEDEEVYVEDNRKVRDNLRKNGATEDEVEFLVGGRRVELNAFGSRELVDWIEGKLKQHKVGKVVPDEATLAEAYRSAFVHQSVRRELPRLKQQAERSLETAGVAADLKERVAAILREHPGSSWDHAVAHLARCATGGSGE